MSLKIKIFAFPSPCIKFGAVVLGIIFSLDAALAAHVERATHKRVLPHPHATGLKMAPSSIVGAQDDSRLTQADLVNGLPSSWRAKLLDVPFSKPRQGAPQEASNADSRKPGNPPNLAAAPASLSAAASLSGAEMAPVDHVLLPIPPQIGIAAFESGDRFLIVVDNAFPMDTQAVRGTGFFSSLSVSLLPDATLIQFRRPDTRRLYLSQQADGWVLGDKPSSVASTQDNHVINPISVDNGVLYPMRRSGRVLTVADPASGERLLVGTSLLDDGGILSMRRAEGYDVWPTLEGVVIAARDPDISLIAVPSGLLLNRDGQKFEDDGQAVYANDVDLKWLDLQDLPDRELLKRYQERLLNAADSQPAERFTQRINAARAALSMGAFKEARGILAVALRDDPEEIGRPEVRFLTAATDLLCGTPESASALEGPWPEQQRRALQLWRALYLEALDQSDERSIHRLVLDLNRLRAYPQHLRDVLLPIAAEAIARHGATADLSALNTLPDEPAYRFARALAAHRSGQVDRAYNALTALSESRDISIAEKATEAKIGIDRERGKSSAEQTVKALDELVLDARLAGREKTLRLMQADAYIQDKQWQKAADIIDLGAPPSGPSHYSTQRHRLMLRALTGIAEEGSQDLSKAQQLRNAALLKAHLPTLPASQDRAALLAAYGEIVLALGLPNEASQAISDAIPSLENPAAKAAAGAALAQAQLARQQLPSALDALAETENPDLPQELVARRDILRARIALASGDRLKGLSILKNTPTSDARLLSAQIFENQNEWSAAANELHIVANEEIHPEGPLPLSQQDLALRLASDASRAGDKTALRWISERIGARRLDETHSRLFTLLGQNPDNDARLRDNDTQ